MVSSFLRPRVARCENHRKHHNVTFDDADAAVMLTRDRHKLL